MAARLVWMSKKAGRADAGNAVVPRNSGARGRAGGFFVTFVSRRSVAGFC